jgi:hypothetical protein
MKKILFGSILAAFLMVSMGFMSPIQVKAVETSIGEVWNDTCDFVNDLVEDEDFMSLLKNEKIQSFTEDYLAGDIDIEQYITQFTEMPGYSVLEEKYSSRCQDLFDLFSGWLSGYDKTDLNSEIVDEKFIRIYEKDGEFKVKEQRSEHISDGILIKFTENSIFLKSNDVDFNDGGFFKKLLEFLDDLLDWLAYNFAFYLIVVFYILQVLVILTDYTVGSKLYLLVGVIILIMFIISVITGESLYFLARIYFFLKDVIDYLEENSKSVVKITIFERINNIIQSHISKFFNFLKQKNCVRNFI